MENTGLEQLGLVLILFLALLAVLLIGHGVMQILFRTIRPLEAWADQEIGELDARQGDTDYGDGYDIWGNCWEYVCEDTDTANASMSMEETA